ncbi:MAG: preprotein translocase subunit SecE [Deltaproteobacteria bacterium]|nr:MAG: preprotein translocase subunit SecE [Deltaproteobacteria bacterium]PIE75299.1 MAG: preprotein translocase subunit SecE [Deltaproteobacteria bacterium]
MGRLQQKKTDQEKREKRKKIQEEKQASGKVVSEKKKKSAPLPVKKSSKGSGGNGKESFFKRASSFLKESRGELKRVVWPGRKQTVASAVMVIVLVIIISSFLGLADFILSGLMALILRS